MQCGTQSKSEHGQTVSGWDAVHERVGRALRTEPCESDVRAPDLCHTAACGQTSTTCPASSTATMNESDGTTATTESETTISRRGELRGASPNASSTGYPPPLDDVALAAAWSAIGEPDEYEEPPSHELRDLADPRNRARGLRARAQRLRRNTRKMQRHRTAATTEVRSRCASVSATAQRTPGKRRALPPRARYRPHSCHRLARRAARCMGGCLRTPTRWTRRNRCGTALPVGGRGTGSRASTQLSAS